MKAPPRSEGYSGLSVIVCGAAVIPLLLRLLLVPCCPEGVVGVGRVATPLGLRSSSVGTSGVSVVSALVRVVVMRAPRRGCCLRWGFLCLWVSRCEALGCLPCGGHEVLQGVLVTQPSSVVPVVMRVTQPLPVVPVVRRRHPRPRARLLLHHHRDPMVSTARSMVWVPWGRPLQLHPGLPGRPVPWEVGGCTG